MCFGAAAARPAQLVRVVYARERAQQAAASGAACMSQGPGVARGSSSKVKATWAIAVPEHSIVDVAGTLQ